MSAHAYNKMKAKKLGSLKVVEVSNDNAYRLKLPGYINTSNVFNVKQLSRYLPASTGSDSGSNPSNSGSPDAAASLTLAPT
uniref:Tf2-1-like SH3-like domain-containing protein n=1 Tax=Brassica oleracea var. oleracea TaxID=109376 RepID=A0A0D3D5M1_BRAOL